MDNIREKTIGQLKSIYIEPLLQLSAAMAPVRVEKQLVATKPVRADTCQRAQVSWRLAAHD